MQTSTGKEGVQSKFNPASQIRSEEKNVGVEGRWRGGVVWEGAEAEMTPKAAREPRVIRG